MRKHFNYQYVITLDVSAYSRLFIAAKYALLDDYDNLSVVLNDALGKEISASYIEQWPLFIQYRESNAYKTFVEQHAELFEEKQFLLDTGEKNDNKGINEIVDLDNIPDE